MPFGINKIQMAQTAIIPISTKGNIKNRDISVLLEPNDTLHWYKRHLTNAISAVI